MAIETNGTPVIMNGDGGMLGGSGIGFWGFLILAMFLFSGNGGFGWGNGNGFPGAIGYENMATSNEVQRGFDNQNQMANQREILSAVTGGTAQSVAATNQMFHDILSAFNDKYSELQRDIASNALSLSNLSASQRECCCEVLRSIDQTNYNSALNTASINANTTAQTQKILDAIAGNKIEALQSKIQSLELAQAMSGVVRYPNGMTYNAGTSPFCSTGNCGCGCGM